MPTKRPTEQEAQPTPEEAHLAAREKHRNRRPRHSFSEPLEYTIVGAGTPCGPPGGYTIVNRPADAHTIRQADTPEET